jgi:hypothetical protein
VAIGGNVDRDTEFEERSKPQKSFQYWTPMATEESAHKWAAMAAFL